MSFQPMIDGTSTQTGRQELFAVSATVLEHAKSVDRCLSLPQIMVQRANRPD